MKISGVAKMIHHFLSNFYHEKRQQISKKFEIVFFSLFPQGVVKIKSVAFLRADKKGILMFNTLRYLYQDLDLLQFCTNTISEKLFYQNLNRVPQPYLIFIFIQFTASLWYRSFIQTILAPSTKQVSSCRGKSICQNFTIKTAL